MALLWSRKQKERRKPVPCDSNVCWQLALLCLVFSSCFLDTVDAASAAISRELPSTRQLRGRPPRYPDLTAPTIPEITGAFEIEVKVRLDSFNTEYNGYNTILNLSNGGLKDAIYLGAFRNPNVISLLIFKNGRWNGVSAYDTVVEGEEILLTVGVDADGTAWIDAAGVRVATAAAVLPDAVTRSQHFFGLSDFWNTRSLNGAILGLRITNKDGNERDPVRRQHLSNLPGQFLGSFQASLYVLVDDASTQNTQGILDFYTSDGQDNVRVVCTGGSMRFELYQDNTLYSVTATNSVSSGQMARWTIGVDASNTMFLEKNGARLASTSLPRLAKTLRLNTAFGNLASGNAPLDGLVLGFRTEVEASVS